MAGPAQAVRVEVHGASLVQTWVEAGVCKILLSDAARLVERRGEYRLYECVIDGSFSKATAGGDGTGSTKVGKAVNTMVLVDARGLPFAVDTAPANHHGIRLVQRLFDFALPRQTPSG